MAGTCVTFFIFRLAAVAEAGNPQGCSTLST